MRCVDWNCDPRGFRSYLGELMDSVFWPTQIIQLLSLEMNYRTLSPLLPKERAFMIHGVRARQ